MERKKVIVATLAFLLLGLIVAAPCLASPSGEFYRRSGQIYDEWNVCRTNAGGSDGFLKLTETDFDPVIARESLGVNIDLAWELGQEFARQYPDPQQRAERMFYHVRNRVMYTADADQFGFADFAQNADEVAGTIAENGRALGDCEDSAVLLAVMYKAAGYRSAVVLAPSHVAALVYLPEYRKAARVLQIGGEEGWVWAEATGRTNPFGWLPEEYGGAELMAREITVEDMDVEQRPAGEATTVPGGAGASWSPFLFFFGGIGLLWLISLVRKRPAKRTKRSSSRRRSQ